MTQALTTNDKLRRLDSVATSRELNQMIYGRSKASIVEQVALGRMISEVRELLTPDVMKEIASLQGTAIGFRTDREKSGGYKDEELKEAVLEAVIRGFRCVDNEFNVIVGRFYAALNGLERKVREYPGLRNLNVTCGVPVTNKTKPDVAEVPVIASYELDGEIIQHRWEADRSLLVRRTQGLIGAALAGKATRQALLRIWKSLGHQTTGFGDDDSAEPSAIEQEEIRRLEGGGGDLFEKHEQTS